MGKPNKPKHARDENNKWEVLVNETIPFFVERLTGSAPNYGKVRSSFVFRGHRPGNAANSVPRTELGLLISDLWLSFLSPARGISVKTAIPVYAHPQKTQKAGILDGFGNYSLSCI
jgi:hypothetical protein